MGGNDTYRPFSCARLTGGDDRLVTVRPVLDRVSGFADLLLEDRDEAFAAFRHAEDIGLPLGAPEFLTGVETIQQTHSRRSVISRLVESDRQMDDKRLDRQVRQVRGNRQLLNAAEVMSSSQVELPNATKAELEGK